MIIFNQCLKYINLNIIFLPITNTFEKKIGHIDNYFKINYEITPSSF